jgi:hypothetical protein
MIGIGLIVGQANAQTNFILSTLQPKNFVNLSVGHSTPTWSPFGKNKYNYMGRGESAQVSIGHRIGRQLGVVTSYSYVTNTVLADGLINSIPVKFDPGTWESSATNCTLQTYMAGPLLSLQAGRFLFDFQLTAGLAVATSSRMELAAPDVRPAMLLTTPSLTTQALATGLGTTIRFKLNRWLAVQANAHYITADVRYKNMVQEIIIGPQQSREPMAARQPVGVLNTGGGLSILF